MCAASCCCCCWWCVAVRSKNNDASDGLDGWIAGWMDDDVSV